MAIKTSCVVCRRTFSAPDEYRGRKVDCPSCGKRTVVRAEADVLRAARLHEEEKRRKAEDHEKIALMERTAARRLKRVGRPYYEKYQTGTGEVRHYNPTATSRFLRLRALSDVLLLSAYVEIFLIALGLGVTVFLWFGGWFTAAVLLICVAVWLICGIALYLLLKCLSELAILLADVGDQQNDLVQLLLDVRENTDPDAST